MPFESLSFRHTFTISNFPKRWLPLVHLYDPDLPLFPIYYFHAISNRLSAGQRPNFSDRIFGFVERINILDSQKAEIFLVVNKDLTLSTNQTYKNLAENEVKERFGLNNPVKLSDLNNVFHPPLDYANQVLHEIWHRVISDTYDNLLPFGRLWDEVIGLTRFVASWNSDKGRKGELIQTHYFCSKFGERIQTGGGLDNVDFFLLPTIHEVMDQTNPLNLFPSYSKLIEASNIFQANNCSYINVGNLSLSKFKKTSAGHFNTQKLNDIFLQAYFPPHLRYYAIECFNALYKGPQRTLIFMMMLSDLRRQRINPSMLLNFDLGCIYDHMNSSYQSPKVIHIYAQQSFGNPSAIPIDIWIETFLKYPLNIDKNLSKRNKYQDLLSKANNIGKIERLFWVSAQARKVHSSACNDALWCIKKASNKKAKGANPLACKICILRNSCPAYQEIKSRTIVFNTRPGANQFEIKSSSGNNTTPNQKFVSCSGNSLYGAIEDDFSTSDSPNGFSSFPNQHHLGNPITVGDFMNLY